jgi:16S rRNA (guanine966-N2)-methyltransferase
MPKYAAGKVRIIAGCWRGRHLELADNPSLRPTSDRIRETVFNWLTPLLPGARCLDLYAGTGALGFEAASRGASLVTLVENNRQCVATLNRHVVTLGAQGIVHPIQADALTWLRGDGPAYDVVFADPPFGDNAIQLVAQRLEAGNWLSDGACVYLEMRIDQRPEQLPTSWQVIREKTAGRVRFCLARKNSSA